jgi:mannose-6-phosphate isomerase-like protein (cupin superfamily)
MYSFGEQMVDVVDTNEFKLKLKENFRKTPVFKSNDEYLGLAWMEGEYRLHVHDKDEVFLILEGHLTLEVDGNIIQGPPGTAIHIKAGEKHRSRSSMKTLVAVFEPQGISIEYLD